MSSKIQYRFMWKRKYNLLQFCVSYSTKTSRNNSMRIQRQHFMSKKDLIESGMYCKFGVLHKFATSVEVHTKCTHNKVSRFFVLFFASIFLDGVTLFRFCPGCSAYIVLYFLKGFLSLFLYCLCTGYFSFDCIGSCNTFKHWNTVYLAASWCFTGASPIHCDRLRF